CKRDPEQRGTVFPEAQGIDGNRLRPAKEEGGARGKKEGGKKEGSHRIDVRERVEREASGVLRGGIPPAKGDEAVREFMKNHGCHEGDDPDGEFLYHFFHAFLLAHQRGGISDK